MAKVLLDMSMSLDGIVARAGDYRLHEWYFASEPNHSDAIIEASIKETGAILMGRRTYDLAVQMNGFDENDYPVPHVIITHQAPQTTPQGTQFTFVTDGIESAVSQAKSVAGDKDVVISGGADIAQQLIKAGLIDEIELHIVPVLMGDGTRLFDQSGPHMLESVINMDIIRVTHAPDVTHIRYRLK